MADPRADNIFIIDIFGIFQVVSIFAHPKTGD